MDCTGLLTMLRSRELKTSTIPSGAARSDAPSARVSVIGNRLLAMTAITAARNVLNIYKTITVRMTPPWLLPEWHRELMTRKNTRSGATALSAPTNTLPRMAMPENCGTAIPRMAPMMRPATIRFTRLMPHQVSNSFFIIFFLFLLFMYGSCELLYTGRHFLN